MATPSPATLQILTVNPIGETMPSRDMTQKQFEAALKRRGIVPSPYDFGLGYMQCSPLTVNVSRFNGGTTRRGQLAYLIKTFEKYEKQND